MVEAALVDERPAAKSVSSHGTTRFADQHRGRQAEGVSCNLAATSFETPAQRHATGPTVSSRLRRTMSAGRLQRTRESSSARLYTPCPRRSMAPRGERKSLLNWRVYSV